MTEIIYNTQGYRIVHTQTQNLAQRKVPETFPRYFATFAGYEIPFRPSEELTPTSVEGRETYYVGRYVGMRLESFEKIAGGARIWLDTYTYWPDGKTLQHRKITKEDGSVVAQDFDRKGRVIKE